jgi:hypothetical protein
MCPGPLETGRTDVVLERRMQQMTICNLSIVVNKKTDLNLNGCNVVGLAPELLKPIPTLRQQCASQAALLQLCCIRVLIVDVRIMEGRPLPEISIEMTWDRAYVRRAIEEKNDTDWETIRAFLSYLGFDVKFVHAIISPAMPIQNKTNVISFPVRERHGLNAGKRTMRPLRRV